MATYVGNLRQAELGGDDQHDLCATPKKNQLKSIVNSVNNTALIKLQNSYNSCAAEILKIQKIIDKLPGYSLSGIQQPLNDYIQTKELKITKPTTVESYNLQLYLRKAAGAEPFNNRSKLKKTANNLNQLPSFDRFTIGAMKFDNNELIVASFSGAVCLAPDNVQIVDFIKYKNQTFLFLRHNDYIYILRGLQNIYHSKYDFVLRGELLGVVGDEVGDAGEHNSAHQSPPQSLGTESNQASSFTDCQVSLSIYYKGSNFNISPYQLILNKDAKE